MKTYLPDLKVSALLLVSYFVTVFLITFVLQLSLDGIQLLLDTGVINPETYSLEGFLGTGIFTTIVGLLGILGLVAAFWITKRFINPLISTRALNISTIAFAVIAIANQIWNGVGELSFIFIGIVMPISIFYFIARKYLLVRNQ